jgi:hypothetical protein
MEHVSCIVCASNELITAHTTYSILRGIYIARRVGCYVVHSTARIYVITHNGTLDLKILPVIAVSKQKRP